MIGSERRVKTNLMIGYGGHMIYISTLSLRFHTDPWSQTIQKRRLAWFGHLIRLPEQTSAKQAFCEAKKYIQ